MRVLFVHGIESGPTGTKVQLMTEQGLQVVAPDQQMSRARLDRRNSVVRRLLCLGELQLTVVLALGSAIAVPFQPLAGLLLLGAIAFAIQRRRTWLARAMASSRDICTRIARDFLAAHPVEVIIGSSWGGAITCQLIASGDWSGPTVLLAPATRKVQQLIDPSGWEELRATLQAHPAPIRVIHDPGDDVVSIAGSQALVGGSITLEEVDAGGHRLLPFVEDGRLVSLVHALATPDQPGVSAARG